MKQLIRSIEAKEKQLGIYDSGFRTFLNGYDEYKEYLEWLTLSVDPTRIDGHNDF